MKQENTVVVAGTLSASPGTGLVAYRTSPFSTRRSGTGENSRSLSVAAVRSRVRACAAISRPFAPIGVLRRASCR